MHLFRLLVLSFLCLGFQPVPAQTLRYEVYKSDERVGFMEVTRESKGDTTAFSSHTELEITMIFTAELDFKYQATFVAGRLQQSLTQNFRGGDKKGESRGHREGNAYLTEVDGDWERVDPAPIDYCILSTYFSPPTGRKRIFSERWGKYLPLNRLEDGRYELEIPGGSRNTFTYKNGRCVALKVNHLLATLDFRLVE